MKPAALAIALSILGATSLAFATTCPPEAGAWVTLANSRSPADAPREHTRLVNRVRALLQAELLHRRVAVCDGAEPHAWAPSARVVLELDTDEQKQITGARIQITDTRTARTATRTVELSHVPPDGRGLTLAVATDELLSALWADAGPVEPAQRRNDEPYRIVDDRRRMFGLGILPAYEIDTAHQPRLSLAVSSEAWLLRQAALLLRLVYVQALDIDAPHGHVSMRGFAIASGAKVVVLGDDRAALALGAVLRLERMRVSGQASANALGRSGAFSSGSAEAVVGAWWATSNSSGLRWGILSELACGAWMRRADARDGSVKIPLERSPLLRSAIGVGVEIP